jgi:hypothetical protein
MKPIWSFLLDSNQRIIILILRETFLQDDASIVVFGASCMHRMTSIVVFALQVYDWRGIAEFGTLWEQDLFKVLEEAKTSVDWLDQLVSEGGKPDYETTQAYTHITVEPKICAVT